MKSPVDPAFAECNKECMMQTARDAAKLNFDYANLITDKED